MAATQQVGIAYVPVLHKGYENFFAELVKRKVTDLYIVSDEILGAHEELDYLNRKDRLRALPQQEMQKLIAQIAPLTVQLLDGTGVAALQDARARIITPNEDIGRTIVSEYFSTHDIEYLDIFLRWHKGNIGEEKEPVSSRTIPFTDLQKNVFEKVMAEADKSHDWWRQVGAALVKDGEVIIVSHNEHTPEAQLPNILGDTRAIFKKGIHINYVTSAHAEVAAIGEAARRGIATEGAELYVTDFPCPYCARLIAKSGVKKVYFLKGYAVLEGDELLKEAGIEIIKVAI